jgi:hypothetical protein
LRSGFERVGVARSLFARFVKPVLIPVFDSGSRCRFSLGKGYYFGVLFGISFLTGLLLSEFDRGEGSGKNGNKKQGLDFKGRGLFEKELFRLFSQNRSRL